ncbi:mucin-5AC-like [Anneissia japonica]|uniref:mucin-5AC-like n=1 Tax=Anneissia japonica TaxID=1529436 RepID=UPI001425849A|nr:mucin-5AC-like [Anneissia japonica]
MRDESQNDYLHINDTPSCPADCDYVLTCEERKKIDSGLDWTNNLSIREPAVCKIAYQQCRCAPGAEFDDEQNKAFSQLINALPSNTGLCEGQTLTRNECEICECSEGDYNDVVGQCRKQCSLTKEDCSKKGLFLYKPEGECCKCSKQETTESPKYDCDDVLGLDDTISGVRSTSGGGIGSGTAIDEEDPWIVKGEQDSDPWVKIEFNRTVTVNRVLIQKYRNLEAIEIQIAYEVSGRGYVSVIDVDSGYPKTFNLSRLPSVGDHDDGVFEVTLPEAIAATTGVKITVVEFADNGLSLRFDVKGCAVACDDVLGLDTISGVRSTSGGGIGSGTAIDEEDPWIVKGEQVFYPWVKIEFNRAVTINSVLIQKYRNLEAIEIQIEYVLQGSGYIPVFDVDSSYPKTFNLSGLPSIGDHDDDVIEVLLPKDITSTTGVKIKVVKFADDGLSLRFDVKGCAVGASSVVTTQPTAIASTTNIPCKAGTSSEISQHCKVCECNTETGKYDTNCTDTCELTCEEGYVLVSGIDICCFCVPSWCYERKNYTCDFICGEIETFDGVAYGFSECNSVIARSTNSDTEVIVRQASLYSGKCCDHCDLDLIFNVWRNELWYKFIVTRNTESVFTLNTTDEDMSEWETIDVSICELETVSRRLKTDMGVEIKKAGDSLIFIDAFGLTLKWRQNGTLNLKVTVNGSGNTYYGRCGIPNNNSSDDLITSYAMSVLAGSSSLKDSDYNCTNCEHCNCSDVYLEKCRRLITDSRFHECSDYVDIDKYLKICRDKVCSCVTNQDPGTNLDNLADQCSCEIFDEYMNECHVPNCKEWRAPNFCPKSCPNCEIYQDCGACEWTCDNYYKPVLNCELETATGCFCPKDKVRVGNECKDINQCGDCNCKVYGKRHFTMFDAKYFESLGNCTYVLSQEKSSEYEVFVTNDVCDSVRSTTCFFQIEVVYQKHSILLTDQMVSVDYGDWVKVPPSFEKHGFRVENQATYIMDLFIDAINLELRFNSETYMVDLSIPGIRYYNKTEGMCGNCREKNIDLPDPKDWIIGKNCTTTTCREETEIDTTICDILYDRPFSDCKYFVNPKNYHEACKCDVSEGRGPCTVFTEYATECSSHNQCIVWRGKNNECYPATCDNDKVYRTCRGSDVYGCDEWLNKTEVSLRSNEILLEGCFCPDGEILSDEGQCIPTSTCTVCEEKDGIRRQLNEKWDKDNCTNCTCSEFGIYCVSKQCQKYKPGECERIDYTDDKCCGTCIPVYETCQPKVKEEPLQVNGCVSAVNITQHYCEGRCASTSHYVHEYDQVSPTVVNQCKCCQVNDFEKKNVILMCSDNTPYKHEYYSAISCGCKECRRQ